MWNSGSDASHRREPLLNDKRRANLDNVDMFVQRRHKVERLLQRDVVQR